MTPFQQQVTDALSQGLGEQLVEVGEFRDELTLIVPQESLWKSAEMLKSHPDLQFNFLEDVVADDYYPEYPRFFVSYHLYSLTHKRRVRLRTEVEDPDEGPKTLGDLWDVASWLEMEVYDLMGIRFVGNTQLRRLFLPEDWQGHPLRKDYPLGYEEVQFSFNYEEIDARKPYAKD